MKSVFLLGLFLGLISTTTHGLGLRSLLKAGDGDEHQLTCDEITEGLCDLEETDGWLEVKGYKLHYFVYSKKGLKSAHTDALPALVGLHGGPGGNHFELYTLKQQACAADRKVILYDQMGAGDSDRPTQQEAPWLWTMEYYLDELDALVSHLNVKKFYLLGHSWGGIVAQLYALRRTDPRLHGLVLASIFSDADLYVKGQDQYLLSTIPEITKQIIRDADRTQNYDTPAYKQVTEQLMKFFTARIVPWPDCLAKAFDRLNVAIYVGMQGPSEFTIGGALAGFNTTGELHNIKVPTLITAGKFDTMTPPVLDVLHQGIKDSVLKIYPHSGHMTMQDDVNMYNTDLAEFMRNNDNSGGKKMTDTFAPDVQQQQADEKIVLGVTGRLRGEQASLA